MSRFCARGISIGDGACEFESCDELKHKCYDVSNLEDDELFFVETNETPQFCCGKEHAKLEVLKGDGIQVPIALPECGESYQSCWRT